ncbi:MAG: excinuclease ABC subunit UvrC [Proteobacteria bacterium]|nr:excinuclease ABC subunit UvrC [Pseudomonadota bacterium]
MPTPSEEPGIRVRPGDGGGGGADAPGTAFGPTPDGAPPRDRDAGRNPGEKSGSRRRGGSLAAGIAVLQDTLKTLPTGPGVYRMIDARDEVLYVGKAKSLRKRVAAYANPRKLGERIARMVARTAAVEVVTTHTEVEALLLESNLIKRYMPRYNILLRDDKSFPYLLITADHGFPQVLKHRGAQSRKGTYFGPFASAWAVNQTLTALQRAFLLRSCSDTVYASRTRPCLLFQIKRCSAPCVGRIGADEYAELVAQARHFLKGGSSDIQRALAERMEAASGNLEYEAAAVFRDRIAALAHVQARQDINVPGLGDADVVVAHQVAGRTCIQAFFFRGGRNFGNRAYFPSHDREPNEAAVLEAFLGQFYANKPPPRLVLLSHAIPALAVVAEALGVRAGHRVEVAVPRRGGKRALVVHALANAREALARRLAESASQRELLDGLARVFGLDSAPERIEVFDTSHISGRTPYGVMVVAGPEGFDKSAYRTFSIKGLAEPGAAGITPGDDYGMLGEILARRFARALKEDPDRGRGQWPDLVLIDGGAGQLNVALDALANLGIEDVAVAAIAKGPDRNAGRERFFVPGRAPFTLEPRDSVLYFLQRLRDEAHRFAVGTHRAGRSRKLGQSMLDQIDGIGGARKRALLNHFGSARAVAEAGLKDLAAVAGISRKIAKAIYDHFHPEG